MAPSLVRHRYGFGRTVPYEFDAAIQRVKEELQQEGFGVLTSIDVKETMKAKLGVEDFRRYVILGACNPKLALQALTAETELGLLLPCNVIVYEQADGTARVAAVDPLSALGLVDNEAVLPVAREATERLERALSRL